MSHIQPEREIVTQAVFCNSQKVKMGIFGTAVTLVALAVIFGALILLTEHFAMHWGSLKDSMQHLIQALGKYSFVPLAVSTPLLITLIVGRILYKKSESEAKEIEVHGDAIQVQTDHKEIKTVTNLTTLLKEALLQENEELVASLIEQGADPQIGNSNFSPIHYATGCDDKDKALAIMKILLQKDQSLANAKTKGTDFTPLHIAVAACDGVLERVKLLVEYGADINMKSQNGYTPLLATVIPSNSPNIEVIEYLIKIGAELDTELFIQNVFDYHAYWLDEPGIKAQLTKCGILIPD